MEFIVQPACASPPERSSQPPSLTGKSETGVSVTFEKILTAQKAEAKETEEMAAEAAAALAAAGLPAKTVLDAATLQILPQTQVQTVGGLSSSEAIAQTTIGASTAVQPASANSTLTIDGNTLQPVPLKTAAELPGFENVLQTGLATTDPIGPEDQPQVNTSPQASTSIAAEMVFTEGTGTDGTKQGLVTAQTNEAFPGLMDQVSKEPEKNTQTLSVEKSTADSAVEPAQAVNSASQTAKTSGSGVENETKAKTGLKESQPSKQETVSSFEDTNKQETVVTKEGAPKPETTAASGVGMEATRQTPLTSEPTLRPETTTATLAQQIHEGMEASIRQGKSSLRIQLSPQDLGAIDIRLVSGPTGVSLTVIAEQASTGRLLEAQINQLRQSLSDAGVQISNLNINQHNPSGQAFQGSNSQANQQPNANRFRRSFDNQTQDEFGTITQGTRPERGIDYRV